MNEHSSTRAAPIELCHIDDIEEGGGKSFDLQDYQLFAIKKGGQVFLYHNSCPHAGLPLNWLPDKFLDRDGELIQCASHGALFQISTGRCVAGPCPGRSLKVANFELAEGRLIFQP